MSNEDKNCEQAILEAATRLFLTKGCAATKTTEIAAEAGVTHAMLHYYFRTKENLFNCIVEQKIELMRKSLALLFGNRKIPLLERIRMGIEAHFDFLAANPEMPRFVINEMATNPARQELLRNSVSAIAFEFIGPAQQELDDAAARGDINPIRAIDLLFDIVSLNLFAFVMFPIARILAVPFYGGEREMLETRRRENVETIFCRLKK